MRVFLKRMAIIFWYVCASLIIFAAIIGVILQALTPVINNHKYYIEQKASSLLNVEVHINEVRAKWNRLGPEVNFVGLSLNDTATGKLILHADDLSVQLSVLGTLWHRSPSFRVLALSGTTINMQEVSQNLYVLNNVLPIDFSGESSANLSNILIWLSLQDAMRLSQVDFTWQQLNGTKFSVELEQANIRQSNTGNGDRRLTGFMSGALLAEKQYNNQVIKSAKSQISLSMWMDVHHGVLTSVEAELFNRNVVLEKNKKIYLYPSFEGLFLWQPKGDNWVLQGKDVRLVKATKRPENYSFEVWRFPEYYAAHLNALNLSDVSILADFLNLLPHSFASDKANIQGQLEDVDLRIPHDLSVVDQYRFSAVLDQLSSAAYGEFPDIHHVFGVISGGIQQGNFVFFDKDDDIYFPNYFEQPISIERIMTTGAWSYSDEKFSLLFDAIHVKTPVATAQGALEIDVPLQTAQPKTLSLVGEYHVMDSEAITRLLPMKEFDSEFSHWLTDAIKKGKGADGKIVIRGGLDDFPYPKQEGVFIVDADIKPLTVSFSPEWPLMSQVTGHMLLHDQALSLSVSGNTLNIPIPKAVISVPNYKTDHPIINVDVETASDAADYLRYIKNSPLKTSVGQWFHPFTLSGQGILSLHLGLPLAQLDADHIQVSGQWRANHNLFVWKQLNKRLEDIEGIIKFSQNSLVAKDLKAILAGESLSINIDTTTEKHAMTALNIDAQGVFSVAQLKKIFNRDDLSDYLVGKANYQAHITIPMSSPEHSIILKTNLDGMQVTLPGPLSKSFKAIVPFSLQVKINSTADIIHLLIKYANNFDVSINLQRYLQEDTKQRDMQIDAHAVSFSWPLIGTLPAYSSNEANSIWAPLSSLTLKCTNLSLYTNKFSSIVLQGKKNQTGFLWTVHANEVQGTVSLPIAHQSPIHADFDYLQLESQKKTGHQDSAISALQAAKWPEFFLNIKQLDIGKKNIGHFTLQTHPVKNGLAFDVIQIKNKLYQLESTGQWVNADQHDITSIQGIFNTNNAGEFLKQMDISDAFQAKAGSTTYNIHWRGAPITFELKKILGDAKVDINDGVIPVTGDAAKMGLGKVLSLFSTQSIQRRLKLNFSDLGQNGYSFNTFISQFHFDDGNANITQGNFDGPEAKIAFTGRIGLAAQDYDLRLVVTPYVTSTLPLIATLAGGPIVGAATYAIDKLAANSIAKLTSYHYKLIGPWSQPTLIDLDEQAKQKQQAKQEKMNAIAAAPVEQALSG